MKTIFLILIVFCSTLAKADYYNNWELRQQIIQEEEERWLLESRMREEQYQLERQYEELKNQMEELERKRKLDGE